MVQSITGSVWDKLVIGVNNMVTTVCVILKLGLWISLPLFSLSVIICKDHCLQAVWPWKSYTISPNVHFLTCKKRKKWYSFLLYLSLSKCTTNDSKFYISLQIMWYIHHLFLILLINLTVFFLLYIHTHIKVFHCKICITFLPKLIILATSELIHCDFFPKGL